MNQQTVLESKRILAILDDLLEDLGLLQHVPAYMSQFQMADLQYLGADIEQHLADHFDLERRIEMGHDANNEELSFAHKHSTRAICDMLRSVGYVTEVEPQTQRDESMGRYISIIRTLRGLMYDKFNTTVEEDLLKFEILRETVSREQTASADVKALNREFQSERSLRKVEVAKRDQAIHKLEEELKTIDENAREDEKEFERMTKEQEQIAQQRYQKEEEELNARVKRLQDELAKLEEANAKEEGALRLERRKREQLLDGLLNQYDQEMTEKTEDLHTLKTDYLKDQTRLEELDKDLKVFDEEAAKQAEEQRIQGERKQHQVEIMVRMEASVKLLQAYWRGYAVRLMMKKKKAGKKRKGGKKKKKGGR
eukprot:TRINITY_DN9234_c0_g1_i1.p1 TRINITY_DN9234_c0_g1~~TRINITY_DN9234_c0_g1_i1.p1  ORF type:complete len:368 (+),score=134.22 TRINITY_DN9234_c0_g1_i1:148-1251(+)